MAKHDIFSFDPKEVDPNSHLGRLFGMTQAKPVSTKRARLEAERAARREAKTRYTKGPSGGKPAITSNPKKAAKRAKKAKQSKHK
jgi:hypothetical protein